MSYVGDRMVDFSGKGQAFNECRRLVEDRLRTALGEGGELSKEELRKRISKIQDDEWKKGFVRKSPEQMDFEVAVSLHALLEDVLLNTR